MIVPDSSAERFDSNSCKTFTQAVEKNRIDFETFSAKVKVDFEGSDGKEE